MLTVFRGGWIVAHDGETHRLVADGVCVVDGDRVVLVGRDWEGGSDRVVDTRGMLVCPGLITTHVHASNNASNALFRDQGRSGEEGANYLNWQAGVRGGRRYRPDPVASTRFALGQCLQSGVTTAVVVGHPGPADGFVETVDEIGLRVYSGPSYRDTLVNSTPDGDLEYDVDPDRGRRGLEAALDFAWRHDGAAGGRLRAILCPGQVDTCARELLELTAEHASALGVPVTIHAAMNLLEVERIRRRYDMTPVELLAECGLLGPRTILGHGILLADHSRTSTAGRDVELLARSGASISHSPLKYLHMGMLLESFHRHREAGVNITIGTDFPPRNIVLEMHLAMLASRVADRTFRMPDAADVFDAATVDAARALGREDLGRLRPGSRADVAVFDLATLAAGAVHDPIRSLIEDLPSARARFVMVDGSMLVEDGRSTTIDVGSTLNQVRSDGAAMLADVSNWLWGGRTVEDAVGMSYPMW